MADDFWLSADERLADYPPNAAGVHPSVAELINAAGVELSSSAFRTSATAAHPHHHHHGAASAAAVDFDMQSDFMDFSHAGLLDADLLPELPVPLEANVADAMELGGEALEGLGELMYAVPSHQRQTSVTWWEDTAGTGAGGTPLSEQESFTEYTLDSADTSVSSTRAPTASVDLCSQSGSASRISRGSRRGFSVVVRGARSPAGYRGRSVTRGERQMPGAALRHRHPTLTPSRGPLRGSLAQVLGPAFGVLPNGQILRHAGRRSATTVAWSPLMDQHVTQSGSPLHLGFHQIGRVREDPAETVGA